MKLIEMKCKNCGAVLEVKDESKDVTCQYCQAHFKIDDEVKHVQYDNMEQSGYDFEQGRIRAQKENLQSQKVVYVNNSSNGELNKRHGCLFYFMCLMFFPFVITYYVIKSEKLSKKAKIAILVLLWIFVIICGIASEQEEKDLEENHWATECTNISDFKYYLDGDQVVIKNYDGSDKKIKICPTYTIEGKEYNVVNFSEGVFALKNVYSVILPDGLISMPSNIFSSSHIKYVYIPASLQSDGKGYSFYNYFHDVKKIYYGGSEEEWATLTNNVDRSKIDAEEIIYNSSIEDLK